MFAYNRISASSRRFAKPLPRHASNSLAVSASRITGTSLVGVLGCRTRARARSATDPLQQLYSRLRHRGTSSRSTERRSPAWIGDRRPCRAANPPETRWRCGGCARKEVQDEHARLC
jgi:hypothetical protein